MAPFNFVKKDEFLREIIRLDQDDVRTLERLGGLGKEVMRHIEWHARQQTEEPTVQFVYNDKPCKIIRTDFSGGDMTHYAMIHLTDDEIFLTVPVEELLVYDMVDDED